LHSVMHHRYPFGSRKRTKCYRKCHSVILFWWKVNHRT